MLLNAGLTTYEKECRKNGMSWEKTITKLAEEREVIRKLGVKISDADSAEIWADDEDEEKEDTDDDTDLEMEDRR